MSKPHARTKTRKAATGAITRSDRSSALQTVSARWIAGALAIVVAGAVLCVWGALCLIFWLGSWQLLYNPKSVIVRTPADAGLQFDSVDFATTESGQPQLHGWWIPGPPESRSTAVFLHGADGNIGDAVPALAPLHAAKLNLLVFDYRGYGSSRFVRPSEAHWREDTEAAIRYLTGTRHVTAGSIILVGSHLGANLALEVAAVHPDLAGVVLQDPVQSPTDAVFGDPRARLVPAHLLFRDRWDLLAASSRLHIPSLWFEKPAAQPRARQRTNEAYEEISARKVRVWLADSPDAMNNHADAVARWVDNLAPAGQTIRSGQKLQR